MLFSLEESVQGHSAQKLMYKGPDDISAGDVEE